MGMLKKIWVWLKKWGLALFGFVLLLVGAGWLWQRRNAELGRVKDELAVAKARGKIAQLQEARRRVLAQVKEEDEIVVEIDKQLADNRRKLVEAHEYGKGLTDDEVEQAFAKLGY